MSERKGFIDLLHENLSKVRREGKISLRQYLLISAAVTLPKVRDLVASLESMLAYESGLEPVEGLFDWSSVDWAEVIKLVLILLAQFGVI